MSQIAGDRNKHAQPGSPRWKQYAAGGPYDLVTDGGNGLCCRRIAFMASGDLTHCLMADGVTDRPVLVAPAGFVHEAQASSISPTVSVVVYW